MIFEAVQAISFGWLVRSAVLVGKEPVPAPSLWTQRLLLPPHDFYRNANRIPDQVYAGLNAHNRHLRKAVLARVAARELCARATCTSTTDSSAIEIPQTSFWVLRSMHHTKRGGAMGAFARFQSQIPCAFILLPNTRSNSSRSLCPASKQHTVRSRVLWSLLFIVPCFPLPMCSWM